jgi:hypothetical protein
VFLEDEEAERLGVAVDEMLGRRLPEVSGAIADPLVRRLGPAGTADQVIDSTPALGDLRYARAVTSVSGI